MADAATPEILVNHQVAVRTSWPPGNRAEDLGLLGDPALRSASPGRSRLIASPLCFAAAGCEPGSAHSFVWIGPLFERQVFWGRASWGESPMSAWNGDLRPGQLGRNLHKVSPPHPLFQRAHTPSGNRLAVSAAGLRSPGPQT